MIARPSIRAPAERGSRTAVGREPRGPARVLPAGRPSFANSAVGRLVGALRVQARLRVSAPGDVYEEEADRVADQVLRMPEPIVQRSCAGCAGGEPCAECEDEGPAIQRMAAESGGGFSAPDSVVGGLGAGAPLDAAARAYFEPRFGRSFGDVRVHTDASAVQSAQAVQARAFTVGRDVVFATGEYAPGTPEGRRLLAHELTHVVQQRGADRRADPVLQRVSAVACDSAKMVSVNVDTYRARGMLLKAAGKLQGYAMSFGYAFTSVRGPLSTHFGTTLPPFAGVLAAAASALAIQTQAMALATYYTCVSTGTYPCSRATIRAWVPWCLPNMPIVLCDPSYFGDADVDRSATLIHEWTHKFWCSLDIGYEHQSSYPSNLFSASVNADNFANLVRDLQ